LKSERASLSPLTSAATGQRFDARIGLLWLVSFSFFRFPSVATERA